MRHPDDRPLRPAKRRPAPKPAPSSSPAPLSPAQLTAVRHQAAAAERIRIVNILVHAGVDERIIAAADDPTASMTPKPTASLVAHLAGADPSEREANAALIAAGRRPRPDHTLTPADREARRAVELAGFSPRGA